MKRKDGAICGCGGEAILPLVRDNFGSVYEIRGLSQFLSFVSLLTTVHVNLASPSGERRCSVEGGPTCDHRYD